VVCEVVFKNSLAGRRLSRAEIREDAFRDLHPSPISTGVHAGHSPACGRFAYMGGSR
jgi:hypothetical protein